MGIGEFFGLAASTSREEMFDIFPVGVKKEDFIKTDIETIYAKIITDVIERTHGLSDEQKELMWDNYVQSEAQDGLITLLSKAMTAKEELFLVYKENVIRKAVASEDIAIKNDYKEKNSSSVGYYISFKNYKKTDMLNIYSAVEYATICSLSKSANMSKTLQVKIHELRNSVGMTDRTIAKNQAKDIALAMSAGRDVYMDKLDEITSSTPELTAVKESIILVNQKRSFYLGLPESYITGVLAGGLGDSGQADAKAIDRGLKLYYLSIVKPIVEMLFNKKTTYKSEDIEQISSAIEVLKTFDITSTEFLSAENKTKIVNKVFGLDEKEKGDEQPKPVDTDPNAKKTGPTQEPIEAEIK